MKSTPTLTLLLAPALALAGECPLMYSTPAVTSYRTEYINGGLSPSETIINHLITSCKSAAWPSIPGACGDTVGDCVQPDVFSDLLDSESVDGGGWEQKWLRMGAGNANADAAEWTFDAEANCESKLKAILEACTRDDGTTEGGEVNLGDGHVFGFWIESVMSDTSGF